MGYETTHHVRVLDPADGKTDRRKDFDEIISSALKYGTLDDISVYKDEYLAKLKAASDAYNKIDRETLNLMDSDESIKWYDCEDDMAKLSKALPGFLFEVKGEGESSGDVWIKWFHNGRVQGGKAQIVLPKLDLKGFR